MKMEIKNNIPIQDKINVIYEFICLDSMYLQENIIKFSLSKNIYMYIYNIFINQSKENQGKDCFTCNKCYIGHTSINLRTIL